VTKILIESDLFLAAIKKEDRLKPTAEKILEKIDSGELKGIYASTATVQEVIFWFYNRQLLSELALAVNILTHLRNIDWIAVTPDICLTASLLINEYNISPFDAYHAATAIFRDKTILGTEHVYNKIKGITRIDPAEFAKDL
jgi:predicted nucleic acid-binding protein